THETAGLIGRRIVGGVARQGRARHGANGSQKPERNQPPAIGAPALVQRCPGGQRGQGHVSVAGRPAPLITIAKAGIRPLGAPDGTRQPEDMSGIIAAAFAVLLTQQAAPHPSTQLLYQPPAIRPFEPPSDFGRETAEGDGGDVHRRPLEAPVKVEAYVRSYEVAPADAERAYEQGVASA